MFPTRLTSTMSTTTVTPTTTTTLPTGMRFAPDFQQTLS